MLKHKIHLVANAHIDPAWMWHWDEGYAEILATFKSALDRLNEEDELVFSASSAAFYAWVERVAPAMFAAIRDRVREGRWVLVGGWWVEADCNIPSGESFARQALYAQRYFLEKFGVTSKTGFSPDSFSRGDVVSVVRASFKAVFGLSSLEEEAPGTIIHYLRAPGHDYSWEYPIVHKQIASFLENNFTTKHN